MDTPHLCPKCGRPLSPNAPQGLCPICLLAAGFPTGTQAAPGDTVPPPRAAFAPPTVAELAPLFPQLEIQECIGQGGMGAVYRARQPALDRLVALKILAPQKDDAPGFAERFAREARALARLTHPNIVAVHDHGQAGPYHYLLMEFVDGVNLRHLLNTGSIHPKEALAIVPQICDALQYAHDQGIVHRDIKPENILLGKNGVVKIADFGLAKLVATGAPDQSLTGAGDVMGTPHYMAPEQVEHPQEVDHRADIYALGVVFYQMLTGELPIGRFGPPSRKVQIDVRLDEIVLRALEKEPELRYQQASGLKTAVETVVRTRPPAPADETTNARADGNLVVVPVKGARLPLRCVKTNQPVTATDLHRKEFAWYPSIIWLSLLATPIAFIILYVIFRHSVYIGVPLSAAGRRRIHRSILIGIVAPVVIAVLAALLPFGLQILPVMVALPVGLLYALCQGQSLRFIRYNDDEIWLAGASPEFLASLPPYYPEGEPMAKPGRPRTAWWKRPAFAATIVAALAVGVLLLVFSIYYANRKLTPNREITGTVAPNLEVTGTVTDAGTGNPIAGTRVADNYYNTSPRRPPQEAWTDTRGHYVLKTWYEEHSIAASAPGYETKLALLLTRVLGRESEVRMDFQLKSSAKTSAPLAMAQPTDSPALWSAKMRLAELRLRYLDKPTVVQEQLRKIEELEKREAESHSPPADQPVFRVLPARVPENFDTKESNPEILRKQLRQAEMRSEILKRRDQKGIASRIELQESQNAEALLRARLAGDRVLFARVKLAVAEDRLKVSDAQHEAGLISATIHDAAQTDVEIAREQLREAETRTAQSAPTADPRETADRGTVPRDELAAAPTDFDAMESNPEILRLQLQQAEKALTLIRARYETGTADDEAVRDAKTAVGLLQTKLAGDRVQFARLKLVAAEDRLKMIGARFQAGVATTADRNAAQTDFEIARIHLREAESRAAQGTPTAAPGGK